MNIKLDHASKPGLAEFDENFAGRDSEMIARELSAGILFPEETRHAVRILRRFQQAPDAVR